MKLNHSYSKRLLIVLVLFFAVNFNYSQDRNLGLAETFLSQKGELTFSFQVNSPEELEQWTTQLSILNFNPETNTVYAWANTQQFRQFQTQNIRFEIDVSDNTSTGIVMSNQLPESARRGPYPLTFPLTAYPTYADYALQMQEFANNHPDICELVDIGGTTEGAAGGNKRLLFLKISDNIATDEAEPKVMYTSSIHGDEITGYPLMLNLINYFITAYKDTGHADHYRIKNLIDNAEVWINPMANPDGTYYNNASNTSVANARRANANGLDLNRNYPDNVNGPHSNGHTSYELETQHFMNLASNTHFVLSANFHGGIEVVNYPWDNTYDRHADNNWFMLASREYADNAQADGPNGYMDDLDNGITHGADWYRVYGGRQDYMNFTHQCKEITIELSNTKLIPSSQLVNHWNYNREALIKYLIQGTYGFQGKVKDALTGTPIEATIKLVGHDAVNSHTVSTLPHGDFYRPVFAGTYDILIEADCYQSVTLSNQTIANYQTITLSDVLLTPLTASPPTNLSTSGTNASATNASWSAATADNFDIRYRILGEPTWTEVLNVSNPYQIIGLNPNTTYEFQVKAYCASNSTAYSASKEFTTTAPIPCSGTAVSAFPYTESFENDFGLWSQGASNQIDWTRFSGLTPSNTGSNPPNTTGPSAASNGNFYLYTESSGSGNNKRAYLISPCLELNGYQNSQLTFDFHMFGANMGTLSLDVSTDNGATYSSLFSRYGNHPNQNANADPWITQTVDLSAYDGQTIKLRFNGLTGANYTSDIAIDNFKITASIPPSQPPTAVCQDITVQLNNSGSATIIAQDVNAGSTDDVAITNYSIDIDTFDCTNIGSPVNVTLTVTDADNQTDSCIATVTVTRQDEPTATNCWDNYVFNTNSCTWENQGTQPTEPTATNCWDNYVFNTDTCTWENQGSQPTEPTATNCWDNYVFNTNSCTWENQGTQPTEPTATNCWDNYVFNTDTCTWENQGTQPAEPTATNCWDNYVFNTDTCTWENQGTKPTEPTATNCWDNYVFNTNTCTWENQGTQPAEPTATNCWDNYVFNTDTCTWENQGTQPAEPTATNCWDNYVFNTNSCTWENQGTQPAEPTATNCWDNYVFNTNTCTWENQGSQPTEPTATNCWDNYVFNTNSCTWQNQGSQPTEPTATNCWDNYVFNTNTCTWENQGTQPTEPTATNCWDNYVFNTNTCTWENQGTQPTEPTATNCWDNYVFNTDTCTWENQGTQPTEPTATNCWDNYVFNTNTCTWENQGTQPAEPTATNCWDNYVFNTDTCTWENQGSQPTEPTATNCWDNYVFNTNSCTWQNQGTQPAEPTATNCWDNYVFNTNSCTWENQGTQPTEPTATNCWDNYVFNTNSCTWENQGTQPAEPTATNCWDNYVFNTNSCTWENQGTQPTEPVTACWETATFNEVTCSWEISNDGDTINPICHVQDIIIELDENGYATITPDQIDNGSTDNCGIETYSVSPNTFETGDIGENNVIFTITDYSGNSSQCNATVTVNEYTLNNQEFNYNNLSIQPNPFKNYVEIVLPNNQALDLFQIFIYDLNGRQVYKKILENENGKVLVKGLEKLEQGPYFIKIQNKKNGNIVIKKLIKF
ncbi:M14 family zinc carboxypeptidase [Oceanihabitans sediminis]|uniref:T9SS C-terminal target domain-containing protein n=3 Tax=Oceanihabitans sediminis TaxID=1812012 RepID=A0A368P2C2_9FLAO|nr:M14 family zinc carboxypeptidase [Oceanihabitans sediminis]RCU56992.1 T9SS C-terminal target domain-containing protein [Oceanihabitans sediminis]